jgi:hypothetical protein
MTPEPDLWQIPEFPSLPKFVTSQVRDSRPSRVHDFEASQVRDSRPSRVRDSEASQVRDSRPSRVHDSEASQVQDSRSSCVRDFEASQVRDSRSSCVRDFEASQVRDSRSSRMPCSGKTHFTNFIKLDVLRVTGFPECPNTSPSGKRVDSDDPIPRKSQNFSKKRHPRNVGGDTHHPEISQRSTRGAFAELPPAPINRWPPLLKKFHRSIVLFRTLAFTFAGKCFAI